MAAAATARGPPTLGGRPARADASAADRRGVGRAGPERPGRARAAAAPRARASLLPAALLVALLALAAAPVRAQSDSVQLSVSGSSPSWNTTEGLVPLYGASSEVTADDGSYTTTYEFIMVLRDNVTYGDLATICHVLAEDQGVSYNESCTASLKAQVDDVADDEVVSWKFASVQPSSEAELDRLRIDLLPYVSFFERNSYVSVNDLEPEPRPRRALRQGPARTAAAAGASGGAVVGEEDARVDAFWRSRGGRIDLEDQGAGDAWFDDGDDIEEGAEGDLDADAPAGAPAAEGLEGASVDDASVPAAAPAPSAGSPAVVVDDVTLDSSNDPIPWGLDRIDQASLPLNGEFNPGGNGGDGVHIYVLDTGILATHEDFTGRVGEGFSSYDTEPTTDPQGHGTHVSGTAMGSIHGVARNATVHPVQVVGSTGSGPVTNVIAGLGWVRKHVLENGNWTAVASVSLGTSSSPALEAAVESLVEAGVPLVASAGNTYGGDACDQSPGNSDYSITVAASDDTDQIGSYSSVGSCVDIVAPGTSILSAGITSDTATAVLSGTSQATPHVTGAVALIRGLYPSWTPAEVKAHLLSSAATVSTFGTEVTDLLVQVQSSALTASA